MFKELSPGDPVFVVMRDECDDDGWGGPIRVTGYVFIACVSDVVIAAPGINGHRDLDYVLAYLQCLTQEDDELPLVAVPAEDCYLTLGAAKEAMQNELDD